MAIRYIPILLIIVLLTLHLSPLQVSAAEEPSRFLMTSSDTTNLTKGEEIEIVIQGEELQQLFGYEINLSYSPEHWQFVKATSLVADGFAVPAIVKEGTVTFAFTKLGSSTSGINGTSKLARLVFKSINEGESKFTLSRVKTVDRNQQAFELTPKFNIAIKTDDAPAIFFSDVAEGFWAKTFIDRAVSLGYINGYPDGTFRPQASVTRAEFVTMIARSMGAEPSTVGSDNEFVDQDKIGQWAQPYIYYALGEGWINGFEDGSFRPEQPVTRAEMTVIASRMLNLRTDFIEEPSFKDTSSIPSWAKSHIVTATQNGLIKGQSGNMFSPRKSTTRAEAVTIMLRMIDYKNI